MFVQYLYYIGSDGLCNDAFLLIFNGAAMKIRITILAILFALIDIAASNAWGGQEQTQLRHNPFPEMNGLKELFPPGFEEMNEGRAAKLMKKGDGLQSNPDYLVESVKVYNTDGNELRYTYTYNENKQMLSETITKWKNEAWVNYEISTYTYDEDGNLLTHLLKNWYNEKWRNQIKNTYIYNESGSILIHLLERWDWNNNLWANGKIKSYTYDEAGNQLKYIEERWENEKWTNFLRYTYTYDAAGNQLTAKVEISNFEELINDAKETNTYDENGKLITKLEEDWVNEKWVKYRKSDYTYDAAGNLLTRISLNWKNEGWVNYIRETITYDNNSNYLTDILEFGKDGGWVPIISYSFTYDENGRKLSDLQERWENEKWVGKERKLYTFDADGNFETGLSEKMVNNWEEYDHYFSFEDSYGNSFGKFRGYKIEITWSTFTSVEDESDYNFDAKSFPNPFSESTTINYTLDNPAKVNIIIYDNLGNKINTLVNEYQITGEYQAIFNADNYPMGMYYYSIQIDRQIKHGKLLLVR